MNFVRPSPPPGKYRLSVSDYESLAAAGAFGDRRTELIGGEVFVMAPEFRPHVFLCSELTYRLRRALEALGMPYFPCSGSVLVGKHDMPHPDVVLTDEPEGEGPIPLKSVALVVEVAASTLASDMKVKAALYAEATIPEYWVVDVATRAVHQLWRPVDGAYTERRAAAFGVPLAVVTLEGLTVDTTGL